MLLPSNSIPKPRNLVWNAGTRDLVANCGLKVFQSESYDALRTLTHLP
jgi:hypothetical protein